MFKTAVGSLFVGLLFLGIAAAQTKVTEVGKPSFETDFPSGGQLRMQIRSADLKIIGGDENKIRVTYNGKKANDIREVKVSFTGTGETGALHISGGPRNDFQIEIHVPRDTGLYLRIPAGDISIRKVAGDKDVATHAGDMNIVVGSPQDYADVDLSAKVGDINAGPFAASKSGFFRHFHQQGTGKYHLRVHVGAGDITLN